MYGKLHPVILTYEEGGGIRTMQFGKRLISNVKSNPNDGVIILGML